METAPKPAETPKSKSNTWKLIAIVIVILIVVGVGAYYLTQQPPTNANVIIQDDSACGATPPDTSCLFNPATYNATVNGLEKRWGRQPYRGDKFHFERERLRHVYL